MGERRLKYGMVSWIDLVGVVLCITLAAVLYLLVIRPLKDMRASQEDAREKLVLHREKAMALEAAVRQLKVALEETQGDMAQSHANLRPMAQMNQRMAELTHLVGDCQLGVDNIQIGKVSYGPQYGTVPVDITGRGPYTQCVVFLQKLRQDFGDFTLSGMEISGTPASTDDVDRFRFKLVWFSAPRGELQPARPG